MRISDWSSDVCSSDLIALNAGVAGGADVILLPEIPYSLDVVAGKILDLKRNGRNFALIVVAAPVKTVDGSAVVPAHVGGGATNGRVGHWLGSRVADVTGAETRVNLLGYSQRGGAHTHYHPFLASPPGVDHAPAIPTGAGLRQGD